jgi:hypothetical protein
MISDVPGIAGALLAVAKSVDASTGLSRCAKVTLVRIFSMSREASCVRRWHESRDGIHVPYWYVDGKSRW